MTKMIKHLGLISLALIFTATLSAKDEWVTDYEKALKTAKAEKKHLLLNFTGSDWCGWCIKLDKEVFDTSKFKKYAKKELILVKLDFPRKGKQSKEEKAQNQKLAKEFGVRGYPTILILDPDGKLIQKTGYQKGGEKNYIQHIEDIIKKSKK
ncbi:thioredoxin family protein [Lentisphaera profundi]|uniref:Thioredoxin family protein n=1 Tax=Lentisphaera profundi TaxID=1658616 RepID=A0ABY7W0L1_9BACT|nr:thioredoxin family protein [Lentisphaera profundi]WDE97813.1 thioredoxin family protein [Lentisphaera profundi]